MLIHQGQVHQKTRPSLVRKMACCLFVTKPSSKPMLPYHQLGSSEYISMIFFLYLNMKCFNSIKCFWKHHRVSTKISEKSSMIFPWLLRAKIQIPRQKKYKYFFLWPMYQFVESITDRHRRTHRHRQFDHSQLAIQLILLVIELIQEVKTTLLISLKWVTDFPINIWKMILISHFHTDFIFNTVIFIL